MIIKDEEDALMHYGTLRRSGRYPWGSGGTQNTRNKKFLDYLQEMRGQGLSDTEIARGLSTPEHPFTTTMLRRANTIAKNQQRQQLINKVVDLKERGNGNVAIGRELGINESSVRALLSAHLKEKNDILTTTSNMLRDQVAEKKYIDIGSGVENHLGISKDKLATAVSMLQEEGYEVHTVQVDQLGTAAGNKTLVKVLAPKGTTYRDITMNKGDIKQISDYSPDGGRSVLGLLPPISISSNRLAVRYKEEGGTEADGVIYVRPGAKDLSIGNARYAQVRIAVDGTHYLKGMALPKKDLPDGIDLVFNTNKSNTGNKLDALKKLKDDPDNPFGSVVRQLRKKDADGKEIDELASAMNIVNEEGNWEGWKKSISTQVLSKQSPNLVRTQLDTTYKSRVEELNEITSLTNPSVKRKLLLTYSDGVDKSAVVLDAAPIKGQASHVILPIDSMKPTEIYAPNYDQGQRVALIRYPHGGTFEIPELTVNNNQREAKALLGQARDAVGISHKVAERLSGADFDGDTVLVIPNDSGRLKSSPALDALKGFDPQVAYKGYEGMPKMSARTKATEMGLVSNLITDMTLKGAPTSEIARAVRHSMVVIDAEKHGLDYKQSAIDNGIKALYIKYQNKPQGGASTLISKATSKTTVPERKRQYVIDKNTGEKIYTETGDGYISKKTGKFVPKTTESVKLAEVKDAHDLSSGHPIEEIYANHSNRLKALANTARKEAVTTEPTPYEPSAREAYKTEVASLNAKLNTAIKNKPRERQAQIIANTIYEAKKTANPDMDKSEEKKLKYMALEEARRRTGASKTLVDVTESEWAAIQAGALRKTNLDNILDNADLDSIKKLATPKASVLMTTAKTARAQSLLGAGHTQAEVAAILGVSLSTLKRTING